MQIPVDRLIPTGTFDEKLLLELFIVLIIWLVATLIHEGGHLLAALAQGMTVREVRIWWLVLTARRRGYRVQIKRSPAWVGGWIKAVVGPGSVRRQMLLFIFGGPACNIACGCISAGIVWMAYPHWLTTAAVFASLALTNLYTGFGNLLPVGIKIPSDGSRLYHWIFHGNEDAAQIALIRLVGASAKGLRARDIPSEDFDLLAGSPNPSARFSGGWFAMRAAMDRGDNASALKVFEEYADRYAALAQKERDTVDPTWKLFLSEQAYIQALEASHSFDARQEWEAPGGGAVPVFMRLRLEAAMHLAEGAPVKAREALGRARREAEDYYDTGTRLEERYLLDIIESRLAS